MDNVGSLFTSIGIVVALASIAIWLLASVVLLRVACWFVCRKDAPDLSSSVAICVVASIAWLGVVWGATLLVIPMMGLDPSGALVARGCAMIVAVFIVSGVYSAMIPTTYLKGVAVFFMQGVVLFAVCCGPSYFIAGYTGWNKPGGMTALPAPNPGPVNHSTIEVADSRPPLDVELASDSLNDLAGLRPQAPISPPSRRPDARQRRFGISKADPSPAPPPPTPPADARSNDIIPPSGPVRPPMLVELESGSVPRIRAAVAQLEKATPDDNQKEINGHLIRLLGGTDATIRQSAARALVVWANSEVEADVVKALGNSDRVVRLEIMNVLATIKGDASIAALIGMLKKERDKAREALIQVGPSAETAVRGVLKNPDMWIREDACKILAKIGSSDSYRALDNATRDPQNVVRRAAADALRELRGEKPGEKTGKGKI